VAERTHELVVTQDVTVRALANLAETRDNETGAHLKRTQHFLRRLALELRKLRPTDPHLSDRAIDLMFKAAPLHDIGKVGIPDHILLKPSKLTSEEFEVMKTHAALGRQALLVATNGEGQLTDLLRCAIEIAGSHHEKWDGAGYPDGLAGQAIPLCARLMAVADVFDALTTPRVYRAALGRAEAIEIIKAGRGAHFDPEIVDAFLACLPDFQAISERHAAA
jgi:putative two-component system response regulator